MISFGGPYLITSAKILFPNKVTFIASAGWYTDISSGGPLGKLRNGT